MRNKKLVILTGMGDPKNSKYQKVYELITTEAKRLNYDEIIILGWKGQNSFTETGVFNFKEATQTAIEFFQKIEESDINYDVICRSYGTGVFLAVCQTINLNKIGFASLWGIPNYSDCFELFEEKIDETIKDVISKGVKIDHTFFKNFFPFDLLLKRFKQKFKMNIVSGSEDKYCSSDYANYLKSLNNLSNLNYQVITGLPHEVTDYHKVYLEKLFENK